MVFGVRAVWRLARGIALWLAFTALLPAALLGDVAEHLGSYFGMPAARRTRLSQLMMCCAAAVLLSW
eukprot:2290152-Alexandrium_andersonii.AAC.1